MEERQQESFDEPTARRRVRHGPAAAVRGIVVLLAVIVVLAIRPWGDEATAPDRAVTRPGQPGGGRRADGRARPLARRGADARAPGDVAALVETCGSPSGWRAATLQDVGGPVAADPLLDRGRARRGDRPAGSGHPVRAGGDGHRDGHRLLRAARRGGPAARGRTAHPCGRSAAAAQTALSLIPLEPDSPDALGGLWSRPGEVTGGDDERRGVWPPGRYVVEIASPGGEYRRWLGIEIADLALLRASPLGAGARPRVPGRASSSAAPAP